jgi:hypothetical protein
MRVILTRWVLNYRITINTCALNHHALRYCYPVVLLVHLTCIHIAHCTSKIMKKTIQKWRFFHNLKNKWLFKLLSKICQTFFFQKHIPSESANNIFFVTSPKLKILIKNVLLYRKRSRKVHLIIFVLVDPNPQWRPKWWGG